MVEIGNVFRGKRKDNGKWVVGFYTGPCGAKLINAHWISGIDDLFATPRLVDPSTIGECTRLKDKNGNWIFEGDILRMDSFSPPFCEVRFIEGAFCLVFPEPGPAWPVDIHYIHHAEKPSATVVGNIHDNPDLLEEHKNA